MPEHECKVTGRIDREVYAQVMDKFHHGQQTKFLRCVFQSVAILIKQNSLGAVLDYMYRNKPLTLPAIKPEVHDATDG